MCIALETKRREQFNLSEGVREKSKKKKTKTKLWKSKAICNWPSRLLISFSNGQGRGKDRFSRSRKNHEQRQ